MPSETPLLASRRQTLLAAASLFLGRTLARAQQEEPTFSTSVKVVSILTTVLDKRGGIVRGLTKDDFSILEEKRPQTIRYFATQSDLPLILGLMVDSSMSQQRVMDEERGASFRFLDRVLRPNQDQVFIVQFDMIVQMRQELTQSVKLLEEALGYVETPSRRALQSQSGGGTLLYDAIVRAAKEVMLAQQGRKALIVLSDGVDEGSEAGIAEAIDAAQRADTLIYSILFSDALAYGFPMGGMAGRSALARMSKETGGGFFQVSKKQPLEAIFDAIQDELRSQYNLGYVSDRPVRISEFRKIQVTTAQKGLVVQARDRYWAKR